jgi:hypothetical protein
MVMAIRGATTAIALLILKEFDGVSFRGNKFRIKKEVYIVLRRSPNIL